MTIDTRTTERKTADGIDSDVDAGNAGDRAEDLTRRAAEDTIEEARQKIGGKAADAAHKMRDLKK